MDKLTSERIILLYTSGLNIRRVASIVGTGREAVRITLKNANAPMRGRGRKYGNIFKFPEKKKRDFAELFGYFFGDGSLSKRKDNKHGKFDCTLTFSLNEKDLVERVKGISNELFEFAPKVIEKKGFFSLVFRRSVGAYLHECGYPSGKKSEINSHLPQWILNGSKPVKISFVRGFFNAESSISKTVSVQQSVRLSLPQNLLLRLKRSASKVVIRNHVYNYLKWGSAKYLLSEYIKESNILRDLKKILEELGISSEIYPVRVHISPKNRVGVHFELRVHNKNLTHLSKLHLITCTKKVGKLNQLCRGGRAVKCARFRIPLLNSLESCKKV